MSLDVDLGTLPSRPIPSLIVLAANVSSMHEFTPLFDDLRAAVDRRSAGEADFARRFPHGDDEHERDLQRQIQELSEQRETQLEQLTGEFAQQRSELQAKHGTHLQAVEFAHCEALREIERSHNDEAAEVESRFNDSTWVTSSVLDDESDESPKRKFDRFKTLLLKSRDDQITLWNELETAFQALAARTGFHAGPLPEPTDPPPDRDAAQNRFQAVVDAAHQQQRDVAGLWLPQLFVGLRSLWLFLILAGAILAPIYLFVPPAAVGVKTEPGSPLWLGIAAGAACVVALIVELLAYTIASMRQSDAIRLVQQSVAEAGWVHQKWLGMARDELQTKTKEFETRHRDVVRQRESALQRFQSAHTQHRDDIESRREEATRQETQRFHEQRQRIERQQRDEAAVIDAEERRRRAEDSHQFESAHSRLQHELGEHSGIRRRGQAQAWHALKSDWEGACVRFQVAADAVAGAARDAFPEWSALVDGSWTPAQAIPTRVRFGEYAIDLAELPGAMSAEPRLALARTEYRLPALLPFPDESSLLLKFKGAAGRAAAIQIQQTILLRLLTSSRRASCG